MRILVVDDNVFITDVLKKILSRAGHEVKTANDPRRAYDLALSEIPDLIISDYDMPGETGLQMLKRIQNSDSRLADVRCILMSGHSKELLYKHFDCDGNLLNPDFLAKPYQAGKLFNALS